MRLYGKLKRLSYSIAGSKKGAKKVRKLLNEKRNNKFLNIKRMNKYDVLKLIGNSGEA